MIEESKVETGVDVDSATEYRKVDGILKGSVDIKTSALIFTA
jgi:hypothetical protein